MNYQMTVIGVAIILAYSALVLIFIIWPMTGVLQKLRWKWALLGPVALVLLAAPWAEEYWIARNFYEACQDAGVHVVKKVEVEGFYDATRHTPHGEIFPKHAQELDQSRFRFMELASDEMPGKVVHIEKENGEWKKSVLEHPSARYHYKYAYQPTPYKIEEQIGWKLEKLGTVAIDSETGETIGRDTSYRRTINVAEGLWRLYWGLAKTSCEGTTPQPSDLRYPLYHYVLIPAKH